MTTDRIEAALRDGRETAGGDGYYIDDFVIDGDLAPVVSVIARLTSEAVDEALEAAAVEIDREVKRLTAERDAATERESARWVEALTSDEVASAMADHFWDQLRPDPGPGMFKPLLAWAAETIRGQE